MIIKQDASKMFCKIPPSFPLNKKILKGAFRGLSQFFATESVLKIMKKVFYFTLKALFLLKISKFLF